MIDISGNMAVWSCDASVGITWHWWHYPSYHCISWVKMIKGTGNTTFSVFWHCWHWLQHHIIPMALSMAPLQSLAQDNRNNVQHDVFVTWSHWHHHQHYVLPTASSKALLHFRPKWLKWRATLLLIMCHQWQECQCQVIMTLSSMPQLHSLDQDDQNGVENDFFSLWCLWC